jgi:hypothetical protein
MKHLIIGITILTSSSIFAAKGLGDIINTLSNSSKKTSTIEYIHRTENRRKCEKEAKRIAQEKVIGLCQAEHKRKCKKLGSPSILSPVEELLEVPSTIEKFYNNKTDNKKTCEKTALRESKKLALLECQKSFGLNASCEVINAVVTRSVTRTVHTSSFNGMFKKYRCTAKAIAQPQINGGVQYSCTVSASAKAKKPSWRDILEEVINN